MNEFIITLRECLEASLIVGIIYTVLDKKNLTEQKKMLWLSVFLSLIASAILGVGLHRAMQSVGDTGLQALLEGVFMYITAALLFYVIFWMSKNLMSKKQISDQANAAMETGKWGVFFLVFFAILREGFETALFLVASTSIDQEFSYSGFFGGIILAVLIGYIIVIQGKKLDLRKFFSITSLLLVFFAAGMIAYGTHEMHEYVEAREAIQNPGAEEKENKVYDIFKSKTAEDNPNTFWYKQDGEKYIHLLHDKGRVGVFFKGLFGYNSDPIWIEVILWFLSLCAGIFFWYRMYKVKPVVAVR
ncbi:MAG: FTR1 family protein [Chitinophagales bacterium]|nr:FTR1 family protein [Bacteroidota bacterium]MBK8488929.1 FTR1 family protein [Bacteroidota bacterium]MBK8680777.1 FTR1 family protein [Bacteroidota bacterium]MBP9705292.1 FTR1 family protein [Chitinophagales bacterium]